MTRTDAVKMLRRRMQYSKIDSTSIFSSLVSYKYAVYVLPVPVFYQGSNPVYRNFSRAFEILKKNILDFCIYKFGIYI